jgi:NADH dehydrogenase/NADH:ubiquinone oxidoreductase subunit G
MFCGALTSKPYAFKVRPWELRSLDAIDIFDGTGSNIRIDFKNYEILRILPKFNQDVNDFWISNKIRYFFDSLTYQRLTYPYIKHKNSFIKLRWKSLFFLLKNIFSTFIYEYHHNIIQFIGSSKLNMLDLFALKIFTTNLGLNVSNNNGFLASHIDFPSSFRFVLPVTIDQMCIVPSSLK